MSCGELHGMDCSEVIGDVYEYLHNELDPERLATIHRHLDECSPCLREYDLESAVRALVHRSCGCVPAPDGLRASILGRIVEIRNEARHS